MRNYIIDSITTSIELKKELLADITTIEKIEAVGVLIANALMCGNKVLLCGNGGSAADAQHLAAEFVGRFITERRALPAIALTTDTSILTAVGNDYGYDRVFERQVQALGAAGDVLIAITTSGNSANVIKALHAAKERGVVTIGLLGGSGGECKTLCDHVFVINSKESARIQELHITIGHIMCGIVDKTLAANE